jgi:tetratricopeptide (TPR) repeat protein
LAGLDDLTPRVVRDCWPLFLSLRGMPVPQGTLDERLAASRADSSSFSNGFWVACAAAYAAQRGRWSEHAALLSHAREIAGRELAVGDSASARAWDRVVRLAEAHGLWRSGRKEDALRAFESTLPGDGGWFELWNVGDLALDLGRLDQAERAFRALRQWNGGPLAYLYLGRILERTGRPAEAREAYEFFTYAWRNADPELQPMVHEARQAVARLADAH